MRMRFEIVALLALALGSCKPQCDPSEQTCATPVSIRGECMAERTCAIDGVMGWCTTGSCQLEKGKTLSVPVDALALGKLKNLLVDYRTHAAGAPDPTAIEAELDGQKGTVKALDSSDPSQGAFVSWSPFPANPQVLTLRFDDGMKKTVDPNFQFEDAACEPKSEPDCSAF